jgi:hypothetical protein
MIDAKLIMEIFGTSLITNIYRGNNTLDKETKFSF